MHLSSVWYEHNHTELIDGTTVHVAQHNLLQTVQETFHVGPCFPNPTLYPKYISHLVTFSFLHSSPTPPSLSPLAA